MESHTSVNGILMAKGTEKAVSQNRLETVTLVNGRTGNGMVMECLSHT